MISIDGAKAGAVFPRHNLVPVGHVDEGVVVAVPGFVTALTSPRQDERIAEIGIYMFSTFLL